MSEAKHTPGPWFTRRDGFSTVYVEARIGGGWLQEVAACGPTSKTTQQEANACLIAAAPEMLEAMQAAIDCEMVPVSSAADGGAVRHSRQVQVADMIRAAIAKATGGAA